MGHHFMNIIEVYNREEMSDAVFIEIAASCKHHPSFKVPKLENFVLEKSTGCIPRENLFFHKPAKKRLC